MVVAMVTKKKTFLQLDSEKQKLLDSFYVSTLPCITIPNNFRAKLTSSLRV